METTAAEMARTVADEGWSVVGVLGKPLADRLLRAVGEVTARAPDAGALEVVPRSHLDTESRYPVEEQPAGEGTVAPSTGHPVSSHDPNRRVRRAAAMALAKLGDPRALDPMRRAHAKQPDSPGEGCAAPCGSWSDGSRR